jgi:N-acetylmuramoyl-L-alanine amidase
MNKLFKNLQLFMLNSFLLAVVIFLSSFTAKQDSSQKGTFRFKTVVIDAGHGGKDPGTHGLHSNEKTVALSIARKLRAAIEDQMPNIHTIMTRSDDTFTPGQAIGYSE